jgi:glycosyltransferase involved in cell wall biosynthesis
MNEKKKYRIAYLSADDPNDVHVWSGSHYSIYHTLQKHFGDVEALGPFKSHLANFVLNLKKVYFKLFLNRRYNAYHSKILSRAYSMYFGSRLKNKKFDFIIAVSASCELAYLKTDIPVVFVSDAIFSGSFNYHKALSNLSKSSIKEGYLIEKRALEKSSFLYLCSQWAQQNAVNDFDIKPNLTAVGPFGANLDGIPSAQFVLANKATKDQSKISLLFVGVHWENKGGPVAVECLKLLSDKGYNVELTVVGCTVPEQFSHPLLKNIPFIKKNTKQGQEDFKRIYLEADFLILPTRFEAYGLVFCEASAFGVISISNDTGGISTPVKQGVNGYLLAPNSKGEDYANQVIAIFENRKLFKEMQVNARKRYDELLNWDAWAINLKKHLLEKKIIR